MHNSFFPHCIQSSILNTIFSLTTHLANSLNYRVADISATQEMNICTQHISLDRDNHMQVYVYDNTTSNGNALQIREQIMKIRCSEPLIEDSN